MSRSINSVLKLLVLQDWESFRSILLNKPTLFQHISSAVSTCSHLNGMTLLHAAVRCNPPLDIIEKMIALCPNMTAATDSLGRTPLHVAAGSGASPTLTSLIAHAHPPACDVQDKDGKTPLHFACDCSCVLFDDEGNNKNMNFTKQVLHHESIAALLSYSVRAVTLRDFEEMIPLQHAVLSRASFRTIRLIVDHMKCCSGQIIMDDVMDSRPRKKARRITFDEDEEMMCPDDRFDCNMQEQT